MINNLPPVNVSNTPPAIFQAQYSQSFQKKADVSWIKAPFNQIALYVHKKLGMHILTAQNNPHKLTLQELERGYQSLVHIGGKPITFETPDGVLLKGMHFIGKGCKEDSPTLILFNGSGMRFEEYGAQTFSVIRIFTINSWLKLGVNVLTFNYRGTDTNPGSATRDGLILDAEAAFQYVHDHLKVPEGKIIFHGHSLGAGIASAVGAKHPSINFCADRPFSSLSQVIKMMFGGGMLGIALSSVLKFGDWEYDVVENLNQIKGHKWVIYHPNEKVIPKGAQLMEYIHLVNAKIPAIAMKAQQFQTKNGLRLEDLSLVKSPTPGQISYALCSTHMRKLRGPEEKSAYADQINIALGNLK